MPPAPAAGLIEIDVVAVVLWSVPDVVLWVVVAVSAEAAVSVEVEVKEVEVTEAVVPSIGGQHVPEKQ